MSFVWIAQSFDVCKLQIEQLNSVDKIEKKALNKVILKEKNTEQYNNHISNKTNDFFYLWKNNCIAYCDERHIFDRYNLNSLKYMNCDA